ncbi:MAG: helix-turn-helix domain-containing protein, partial [Pseudomonadota bacterium]
HIVVMNPGGTVKIEDLPEYLGRPVAAPPVGAVPQFVGGAPVDNSGNIVPMPVPAHVIEAESAKNLKVDGLLRPLWKTEKDVIEAVIEHCNGNISRAARILEISPSTIYRKREQWEKWLADEMSSAAVN